MTAKPVRPHNGRVVFPGFSARDFDAYAPQKWKSNLFTRERLDVKQKLASLSKLIGGGLLGSDGSPLACEASAEYPALWNHKQVEAQHLYFYRSEGERRELDVLIDRQRSLASLIDDPSPHKNHPYLAVTVTHQAVRIAFELPPDAEVDRRSLQRKCEDFFEQGRLHNLLHGLAPDYEIGLRAAPGTGSRTRTEELTVEALAALLATLASSKEGLTVGRSFSRDDARLAAPEFAELARSSLADLLPIYRFIAWTRDNDFLSMRETLRQERQAKRQKHLVKNDRVRIVRGMFAGKIGQVQELDGKGTLRILIGKMVVKVGAEDVVRA